MLSCAKKKKNIKLCIKDNTSLIINIIVLLSKQSGNTILLFTSWFSVYYSVHNNKANMNVYKHWLSSALKYEY